jgi:hypothetical protein
MARGDELGAEGPRPLEEKIEFDEPVAPDARIRRAPLSVLSPEIVDDQPFEGAAHVRDVMRDPQGPGDLPGVVRSRAAAAAPQVFRTAGFGRQVDEFHGQADHLIAFFQEKGGGHGRVHPAAHGDRDQGAFSGAHGRQDSIDQGP